jgi:hypothetical protein
MAATGNSCFWLADQVSVYMAKQFQRRRFLTQKQELHVAAMFANRSGRNEQSS